MENVGVIKQYNQLMQNPLAGRLAENQDFSIDKYVVGKTMDGLFYVMGRKKRKSAKTQRRKPQRCCGRYSARNNSSRTARSHQFRPARAGVEFL